METSPPQTRFSIPIRPKDGSEHRTLMTDLDGLVCPNVDDAVLIDTDYGVSAYVQNVAYAPTNDPSVYVNCRSLFPVSKAEADEIVAKAVACGWKVI